jgi:photosystem I P700 chlorophyll a apoprotein A1
LTEDGHHHLAVAVVFLVAGYLYRTQFSIDRDPTHELVDTWHTQLAINLGFPGTASIITGHLLTAYPAYSSRLDWYSSRLDWYSSRLDWIGTHHAWIGLVLITPGLVVSSS